MEALELGVSIKPNEGTNGRAGLPTAQVQSLQFCIWRFNHFSQPRIGLSTFSDCSGTAAAVARVMAMIMRQAMGTTGLTALIRSVMGN